MAAGVPLFVLLVALLALLKQNLQALQGVVDSVDRLLERLRGFMAPDRATEGDVEMGPVRANAIMFGARCATRSQDGAGQALQAILRQRGG